MIDELKQWEFDKGYQQGKEDGIREYRNKVIDDVSARAQANEKVFSTDGANMFNYATRTFIDSLNYFAQQLKEQKNE